MKRTVPSRSSKSRDTHGTAAAPAGRVFARARRYLALLVFLPAVVMYYWPVLSAQAYIWNDFIEQNFPYRLFAAVWMKKGVFPFWNPYVFSGMPFFADIQAAVLYPLNLMLTPFASRDWLSPVLFEYEIVCHYLLGGLFMYALARDMKLCRLAACASGLVFMFSAFMSMHIFHVNLVHSAAWFPLIVLCLKRMLDRVSLLYCCAGAFLISLSCFAGYPQLLIYMYYWCGAYYLFFIVSRLRRKTGTKAILTATGLFALMMALSAGMSAVQLVPTLELGANSARPTMTFAESCEGSFRFFRFITLLVPDFFGNLTNTFWGLSAADVNPGVHYYWETAVYLGILPLILSACALVFARSPLAVFFGVIGAAGLLLSMGDSFFFYGLAYKLLPFINRFRTPARFAFIFGFSVSALTGHGLHWCMLHLPSEPPARRRIFLRWLLGAGAIVCAGAFAVSAGALKGWVTGFLLDYQASGTDPSALARLVDTDIYPFCVRTTWRFCVIFAAAVACLALRCSGRLGARWTGVLACLTVFADLALFGYGYAGRDGRRNDPSVVFAQTSVVKQLQQQLSRELFRINSRDSRPGTTDLGGRNMIFQKNQGSVHGLFLMEGYNPLRLKRQLTDRHPAILDILNVKYFIRVDGQTGRTGFALNETRLPRAWMVYDWVVEPDPDKIIPLIKADSFDHRRTVVLEAEPSLPRAPAPPDATRQDGTVTVTAYSLNEITLEVETPRPGLCVLSEIQYPAWKASIGPSPCVVHRADYALRAIEVPAGRHLVRCYFDSQSFTRGLYVSLLSWAVFAASIFWALRARGALTTGKTA